MIKKITLVKEYIKNMHRDNKDKVLENEDRQLKSKYKTGDK
mgnify:CR=1 FL=1